MSVVSKKAERRGNSLTHGEGLAARSINGLEVTAQSVANVAPSAVIAFGPAAMAGEAGYSAWVSFVIASVGVFAIAFCITLFARRRASVGSLYALSRLALPPSLSFVTGWALIIGVIGVAGGSLAGAGYFISKALASIGIGGLGTPTAQVIIDVVVVAVALYLTVTSVRRAAVFAAVLEIISISFIVVILLAVFIKGGHIFDTKQLSLKGFDFHGVSLAIVMAVLGFVGFESAAALGEEAKDPATAVPRAIWRSAILAAVLYTFATYTQVAGFHTPAQLAASASPMDDLAGHVGLSFLRGFINLGFSSSFFAVVVACMNVAGRILFGMSREGITPSMLGRAHPRHRTPQTALLIITPLVLVPCAIMVGNGDVPLDVTTWVDEIGVYGYMLSYVLICIAAPLFMRKLSAGKVGLAWACAAIGAIVMVYSFYKQLVPVPAYPLNVLPYVFLGALMLGVIGYAYVYIQRPEAAKAAGSYADDLTPETAAIAAEAPTIA